MYQVCVFYEKPSDPAAFDSHYSTVHRAILGRLPGLRHGSINWPRPQSADDVPPYHLVTVMYWDDRETALASLSSLAGREAADDDDGLPEARTVTTFAESSAVVPFALSATESPICGVLGLYGTPADPAAFRSHYEQTHRVLAARMPLQTAFTVSWTAVGPNGEEPRYHLIGNQQWRSDHDFALCLASPEAAAAIADLDTFVDGGMTMLSCSTLIIV